MPSCFYTSRGRILLVACLILLATASLLAVPQLTWDEIRTRGDPASNPYIGLDAYRYVLMGLEGPSAHVLSPFAYRVAFPWLAYFFHVEPLEFYRGVSFVAVALTALGIVAIGRKLGIDTWASAYTSALVMLTGIVKTSSSCGNVTDLPFMAATTWAAYFFLTRNNFALTLVVCASAANRELSFLLVFPAVGRTLLEFRNREIDIARALGHIALLLMPAGMVTLAIRAGISVPERYTLIDALRIADAPFRNYVLGYTGQLAAWLFVIAVAAALKPTRRTSFICHMFLGGIVVAACQLFLGQDKIRMGAPLLPFAAVIAADVLQSRRPPGTVLILIFVAQYLSFVTNFNDPTLFSLSASVIYVKYALAGASMAFMVAIVAWALALKVEVIKRTVTRA